MDDGTADPIAMLKKLIIGRISATALQTVRADKIIEQMKEFSGVKKLDYDKAPFDQKPYFIMLSHQFVKKYPEFSELF